MNYTEKNLTKKLREGSIDICWLGGAGFVIRSSKLSVGIDIYLSDACKNDCGDFKRLIPPPVSPENLSLDYLISSHDHGDHLDTQSIHQLMNEKKGTKIIGPGSVMKFAGELGIDSSKMIKLDRNEDFESGDLKIRAVTADHADLSIDAIGLIITLEGRKIYFTGDTCFRTDLDHLIGLNEKIDVLLVPINGKYGNPDSRDAAYITQLIKPRSVIPCHFWLFKEHGGDPGEFAECCKVIAPEADIRILSVGECITL